MSIPVLDRESIQRVGRAVRWVEGQSYSRLGQFGPNNRAFQSVEIYNDSAYVIPEGGVMRIWGVRGDGIYHCVIPQHPSIKSFGVVLSPIAPYGTGSMALRGIVRAMPYDWHWAWSEPIGRRWNIHLNTVFVSPNSMTGPFISVGRDPEGYILVRIDNGRNFGV